MPSSDDMFGGGQSSVKQPMMTDHMPPGMFNEAYAAGKMTEPTPEEMEDAANAVRYSKVVKVKEFHVGTFDLSDVKDLEAYKAMVVQVYQIMAEKRGVISFNEKKLIVHEGKPKMIVHMEWYEYTLKVTDHMIKPEDAANGKKKRGLKKVVHSPA